MFADSGNAADFIRNKTSQLLRISAIMKNEQESKNGGGRQNVSTEDSTIRSKKCKGHKTSILIPSSLRLGSKIASLKVPNARSLFILMIYNKCIFRNVDDLIFL
ncbi:hypothetical protein KSP40_PGU011510 [Platanthera guangdongensis]|uniref:Uncharacterized protein n=1 Tax=Platanthera guangdongensis TaxID=2320717 RepID=A0ABR2N537_9ASPA